MKTHIISILAFLVGFNSFGISQTAPLTRPNPGFESMERPETMPLLHTYGTITKQAIAYDQTAGNNDGNFAKAFIKYIDKNGEVVIFDEYGPGCLYRQQMNVWVGYGGPTLLLFNPKETNARIKYYFDDEKKPRLDVSMDDLFGCRIAPYNIPLTFMDDGTFPIPPRYNINSGRFSNMYYPFNFNKRLKITFIPNTNWNFRGTTWYQNTFIIYPKNEEVTTWKDKESDSPRVREQWLNTGKDPKESKGNIKVRKTTSIAKGKTKTILHLKGQGSIASLKLNLAPFTKETFYNTNIQIYWDNETTPSIDVPVGYLFGGGGKDFACSEDVWQKALKTLFFGYDKKTGDLYSYWSMPYWKSAKIVIQNNSNQDIKSLSCEVQYKSAKTVNYPKGSTGHFYVKRTTDSDTGIKPYTTAFHETGRGHVVGITFFTEGYDMDGDEFTYIDGSRTPQMHGSGTEDDHNQGWGGTAYQKPLWGGLINGFQGAYRIYMNDSYIFNKDITINYEYSKCKGMANGGKSDVTIYYYKSNTTKLLELTDEINIGNSDSEKKHDYIITGQLKYERMFSAYDGYEKKVENDTLTDDGRSFNGSSQFTVKLNPDNSGIRLRKRINRTGNGIQTAKVFVNGQEVGIWHIVESAFAPANQSWFESDFEIPAEYTQGKQNATVKIEYLYSDSNNLEINEFYYWVYCYPKQ